MIIFKSKLLLLSAGPVGDHVALLDLAQRFYLSEKIETVMIVKNNYNLLSELSKGYSQYVKCVDFKKVSGVFIIFKFLLTSFFSTQYLVYFFAIPYKKYLVFLGNFLHIFSRMKVISLEYKGLEDYIPRGIHIKSDLNGKYYYEAANDVLKSLNFNEVKSIPKFSFLEDRSVLDRYSIKKKYVVIHPTPSRPERRIEIEKWLKVFSEIKSKNELIVFTGAGQDSAYIDELSASLDSKDFIKIINAKGQDLINIFDKAEELFMVHTGPTHIAAALHKKMYVFCHLRVGWFDMSYNKNATVNVLSTVKNEVELNESFGFDFKKRKHNNWQVGAGRLGDFMVHVDIAKRLYDIDGSVTKVILMGNIDYLSGISKEISYVKVYPLNAKSIVLSFLDYIFKNYSFMWVEPINPSNFGRRKILAILINLYVLKSYILSRGKVFIHRDEECFTFINKKNIYESKRGEYMFYENNIKMLDYFYNEKQIGVPIFDYEKNETLLSEIKNKYDIKNNYYVLNITASESFKYASHLVWQEVFDMIELSKKSDKDSVFRNKQIVITGEPKDKEFLNKLSLSHGGVKRLDGLLSFKENTELILGASGLVTMRTGAATLATMLPISYKVFAIVPLVCHNWDYDYYKNLITLRAGENCLCTENGHKKCLQKYEDNVYRVRCVGDIKAIDILSKLKQVFS